MQFFFPEIYPEPFLLSRITTGILATDLTTYDSTLILADRIAEHYLNMLDVDTVDKKVYFISSSHIYRVNFDGTGKEMVLENSYPRDIAIDWIGRRIIWSSINQNKINIAGLDNNEKRELISTWNPVYIAVEPIAG
jgi:hypothetical protein